MAMNPASWILLSVKAMISHHQATICSKWGQIKQSNNKIIACHEQISWPKFAHSCFQNAPYQIVWHVKLCCNNWGNIGLKSLKNLAFSYPLFVHSIEVWHFAYWGLTHKKPVLRQASFTKYFPYNSLLVMSIYPFLLASASLHSDRIIC